MQPTGNYQPIPGEYVIPSAPPSYEEATYSHQPYPPPPHHPGMPPPHHPGMPPPGMPPPHHPGMPPPHHPGMPPPHHPGMEAKPLNPTPPYAVNPPLPTQAPVTVQTVYVQQPVRFHDRPVQICCPRCSRLTTTHLVYSSGALAWLSCGGLCLLGCGFGCCLIPFCIDSLKDVDHYCSNCQALIGSYKRL